MAAGDAATAAAKASSPTEADHGDSAVSSPLSDVEDKEEGDPAEDEDDDEAEDEGDEGDDEEADEEEDVEAEDEEEGHEGTPLPTPPAKPLRQTRPRRGVAAAATTTTTRTTTNTTANEDEDDDDDAPHDDDVDDESNLSDARDDTGDADNDSEAETERLFHTPKSKSGSARPESDSGGLLAVVAAASKQFTDRPPPQQPQNAGAATVASERSPSKLRDEILPDAGADVPKSTVEVEHDDGDAAVDEDADADADGDADAEGDADDLLPSSPLAARGAGAVLAKSATLATEQDTLLRDTVEEAGTTTTKKLDPVSAATADVGRKRKRSPLADTSESEQPLRKRTTSATAAAPDKGLNSAAAAADEDVAMVDEGAANNADTEEGPTAAAAKDNTGQEPEAGEKDAADGRKDGEAEPEMVGVPAAVTKAKKAAVTGAAATTRSSPRKRKEDDEDAAATTAVEGEAVEDATAQTGDAAALAALPEDEAAPAATEEEHMEADAEAEEDVEEAARNAEELERKKVAFDQLSEIEKQFATFRDRLYDDRISQLEQEEAMLRADKPTHPEYLAMMQCVDQRLEDKLRHIRREHDYRMEALDRWAVSRRAQVLSQFYQSVRESREDLLENLGRQWYEIQHERRRHANTIPDYGIRFPQAKTQRIKDAIAYNKEVSILSGIAKYRGFPAAPDVNGASGEEVDDDMEAIARAKQAAGPPVHHPPFQEYGSLSFGRSLGPAGEQFLEQTPWANPNHPSNAHLLQRPSISAPDSAPQQQQQQQTNANNNNSPQQVAHVKASRVSAKDQGDKVLVKFLNGPSSRPQAKPPSKAKEHGSELGRAPSGSTSSAATKAKSHAPLKAEQDGLAVKTEAVPTAVRV